MVLFITGNTKGTILKYFPNAVFPTGVYFLQVRGLSRSVRMLGALCRALGAESLCHLDDCSRVCDSYLYYHRLSGTAGARAFHLSL